MEDVAEQRDAPEEISWHTPSVHCSWSVLVFFSRLSSLVRTYVRTYNTVELLQRRREGREVLFQGVIWGIIFD